jgi:hypothetical protein
MQFVDEIAYDTLHHNSQGLVGLRCKEPLKKNGHFVFGEIEYIQLFYLS